MVRRYRLGSRRAHPVSLLVVVIEPLVRVQGLEKSYRRGKRLVQALRGIDLTVSAGELLLVMGPSGGGKSTLLNLIGGLDRPDGGTIRVAGRDVTEASNRELDRYRRDHVGFVFQFFNLIPTIDARDNVALALLARGTPWRESRRQAEDLLGLLGLGERLGHVPAEMSGGEQQRVAIARAIAGDPDLLLADEPTGDVDAATTASIMETLVGLNRDRGLTIVAVTHDPALVPYAHRVVTLRDGRLEG